MKEFMIEVKPEKKESMIIVLSVMKRKKEIESYFVDCSLREGFIEGDLSSGRKVIEPTGEKASFSNGKIPVKFYKTVIRCVDEEKAGYVIDNLRDFMILPEKKVKRNSTGLQSVQLKTVPGFVARPEVVFGYILKMISEGKKYKKTADYGKESTYHEVLNWINAEGGIASFWNDSSNAGFIKEAVSLIEKAKERVEKGIILSEFEKKMISNAVSRRIDQDNLHLVVYFPYYMTSGSMDKSANPPGKGVSRYQGLKGGKMEMELTVVGLKFIENDKSISKIHELQDDKGNMYSWWSNNIALKRNQKYKLSFIVKDHRVFRNIEYTIIKNVKVC